MEEYFEQTVLQEDEEPPSTIEDAPSQREAVASTFSHNRDKERSVASDGRRLFASVTATLGMRDRRVCGSVGAVCRY